MESHFGRTVEIGHAANLSVAFADPQLFVPTPDGGLELVESEPPDAQGLAAGLVVGDLLGAGASPAEPPPYVTRANGPPRAS